MRFVTATTYTNNLALPMVSTSASVYPRNLSKKTLLATVVVARSN